MRVALYWLLGAVAVGLTLLSATPAHASAAADDRCMWHGLACTGGWTGAGTVVGKRWTPPRDEYHAIGKRGHIDHLAQCWRLDLRWGPFTGWICMDHDSWQRARPGDRVEHEQLVEVGR